MRAMECVSLLLVIDTISGHVRSAEKHVLSSCKKHMILSNGFMMKGLSVHHRQLRLVSLK